MTIRHDARRARRLVLTLGVLLATGCGGGGGGPTGPGGGSGRVTATIDGQAWASTPAYVQSGATQQSAGHFPVYGARLVSGNVLESILLNLSFIPGPGTYPLGTAGGVAGGIASVNLNSPGWMTPLSGAAGTVTIASITANRIAGTFSFVADQTFSGATGTKTVTNGEFDVPLTAAGGGALQTYSPDLLTTATLTIGTEAFKPGTATAAINQGALVIILANTRYSVSISVGPFNGTAGTYPLAFAPFHRVTVGSGSGPGAPCCWGGHSTLVGTTPVLDDAGTITITAVTATRVRGNLNVTLAPGLIGNATTSLTVSGTFDVALH